MRAIRPTASNIEWQSYHFSAKRVVGQFEIRSSARKGPSLALGFDSTKLAAQCPRDASSGQ